MAWLVVNLFTLLGQVEIQATPWVPLATRLVLVLKENRFMLSHNRSNYYDSRMKMNFPSFHPPR